MVQKMMSKLPHVPGLAAARFGVNGAVSEDDGADDGGDGGGLCGFVFSFPPIFGDGFCAALNTAELKMT